MALFADFVFANIYVRYEGELSVAFASAVDRKAKAGEVPGLVWSCMLRAASGYVELLSASNDRGGRGGLTAYFPGYGTVFPDEREPPLGAHQGVGRKNGSLHARDSGCDPQSVAVIYLLAFDAAVGQLGLEAELFGEFGEAGPGVVLLQTAATAATLIGGAIGALVSGSPEGDEFVETIAHAGEGTSETFNETNGVTGIVTLFGVPADHGEGQFFDAVDDVTDGATELAGSGIFRRRRRLNVGIRRADHSEKKCRKE